MIITLDVKSNMQEYAKWLNFVPEHIQTEVERKIPTISRGTKRTVKSKLVPGMGVDEGVYKASFKTNNFAESKWEVGFQVFAKKPHYRLTHLLEDGHEIWLFTPGTGRMTRFGNIGMSHVSTLRRPSGRTNAIEHIQPGQTYADEKVIKLYKDAIEQTLKKGMKK